MAVPFDWIGEDRRLEQLAGRLADVPVLGLDMEADAFHCYRPKICLIQLSWLEGESVRVAIVDPLAVSRDSLLSLRPRLEGSADRNLILHGGAFDVSLFKRDLGVPLGGVFDTELAARLLGYEKTGLTAMAELVLGSKLDKGARRTDWSRRPLSARSLDYAARDVAILHDVKSRLEGELATRGRLEWARQEFERVESTPAAEDGVRPPEAVVAKLKGVAALSRDEQARLRAFVAWREREAASRDVPAAWIVEPSVLVAVVRRRPASAADLVACGVRRDQAKRYGPAILDVLEEPVAASGTPDAAPARERALDRLARERLRRLRDARNGVAETLGIDPGVLCPGELIKCLVRGGELAPERFDACGFRPWQIDCLREAFDAAECDRAS